MAAAAPGIAIVNKLSATAAVTAIVSTRITPQFTSQEPTFPALVYTVIGSETPNTLAGKNRALKRYTVQIDCFAATETATAALAKLVVEALAPDGTPWTSTTDGVQGCFHVDTEVNYMEDGSQRFQSETFTLWHTPT